MSNVFIALLLAVGASVWIYSKFMYRTGGNAKSAVSAAGVSGVLIFVILLVVLSIIF